MPQKKIKVLCLTLSYANSSDTKNHVAHVENSFLVKNGFDVKTITHHVKGTRVHEIMDSVLIKRYRYLPEKWEFNTNSFLDTARLSKINLLKVFIMNLVFSFFTFFECLKEKPNIILAHFVVPAGFIGFLMSKIFKIKFIVSIHGEEVVPFNSLNFLKNTIINAVNNASLVIINSNFTKNRFVKAGIKKEKIRVIHGPTNYVEHSSDKKFLEQFRKKFTKPSNKIILYVGRFVEAKGIEYLIRSLQEIKNKNVHLILAGDGILFSELKNLVKSLNLQKKVTFFGRANRQQLGWLYKISDVFVVPSIIDSYGSTESMGLVIPEAMESGLPVIASSVGGIIEIMKNEVNGLLVPQKDTTALANAIDRVLSDEIFRKKIIENSKETVKEFSHKETAEGYVNAINFVLDS